MAIDFQAIARETVRIIEDTVFQEHALKYLRNQDNHAFGQQLKTKFFQIMNENLPLRQLFKHLQHVASSFQYISPNFGDYFRFRYPEADNEYKTGHPKFKLSAVEEDSIERLRTVGVAQLEMNLLFSDDLVQSLQVQFGGNSKLDPTVFHVDKIAWTNLRNDVLGTRRERNFIKLLLADDLDALTTLAARNRSLLDGFRNYLDSRMVASDSRRLDVSHDQTLLRVFLLTYFYTIVHAGRSVTFHLIVPINLTSHPQKTLLNKVGSYCGAFKRPVRSEPLETLAFAFRQISIRFAELEWISVQAPARIGAAVISNLVQMCSYIQDNPPIELRQCSQLLKEIFRKLEEGRRGYCESITNDGHVAKILERFCTTDYDFLDDLLQRLNAAVPKGKGRSAIFLYSEPGNGKETIAKLCHSFSPRAYDPAVLEEIIQDRTTEIIRSTGYQKYKTFLKETRQDFFEDLDSRWPPVLKINEWSRRRINFNFRTLNCALANEDILWGDIQTPGEFAKVHLLGGTLFMDEIDKMRSNMIDQLLRVLADPYEISPKEGTTPIEISVLLVFASNEPLEKFSGPFASRVAANYFRIPPLRERPEDIPLLVNHFLRRYNEENPDCTIRHIDANGLTLLMKLKWENNVRALEVFVQQLCHHKERIERSSQARGRINFEDVLVCLTRGGVLR